MNEGIKAASVDTPGFREILGRVQGWSDGKPVMELGSQGAASQKLIAHINAWSDERCNTAINQLAASGAMLPVTDSQRQSIEKALEVVEAALQEAHDNAFHECCGHGVGGECCGNPEPAWSAEDQKIMNALAPAQRELSGVLRALTTPVAGWVSVEERLPEDDCRVIAATWRTMTDEQFIDIVSFRRGTGQFSEHPVTHWMPLPPEPAATPTQQQEQK